MSGKLYNPIVITGPSGSGKTELIDYVEKNYSDFMEADGVTTRPRRDNELGRMGFLTRDEFEKLIAADKLIDYCIYNNNYYGTPKSEFEKLKFYHLMFNVTYSSAKVIKELYDKTTMIYLLPPTKEELLRRLGNREYERYLLGIQETMNFALKYDYLLLSLTNDLKTTAEDFMDIVSQNPNSQQKRLVLAKNRNFVNNFYSKRGLK